MKKYFFINWTSSWHVTMGRGGFDCLQNNLCLFKSSFSFECSRLSKGL